MHLRYIPMCYRFTKTCIHISRYDTIGYIFNSTLPTCLTVRRTSLLPMLYTTQGERMGWQCGLFWKVGSQS